MSKIMLTNRINLYLRRNIRHPSADNRLDTKKCKNEKICSRIYWYFLADIWWLWKLGAIVTGIVMTFMFLIIILGSTDERAPKGFAGLVYKYFKSESKLPNG